MPVLDSQPGVTQSLPLIDRLRDEYGDFEDFSTVPLKDKEIRDLMVETALVTRYRIINIVVIPHFTTERLLS